MCVTNSMAEVAGRNARRLRLNTRPTPTLEDLARAVRTYGLRWSTGSVGSFESGRTVGLTLETLVAVAAGLGDAIGRAVTLQELFADGGDVAVNPDLTIRLSKLQAVLSGEVVRLGAVRPPRGAASGLRTWPPTPTAWWSGVSASLHAKVFFDFREGDVRMCKNIGVEPDVGAMAMAKLWKKTFVARRDELAGPGAKPQRRGQISRRLKAELQELIG